MGVLVIRFMELSCAKHIGSVLVSPSHAATLFRRSLEKGKMSKWISVDEKLPELGKRLKLSMDIVRRRSDNANTSHSRSVAIY